MGFRKVLRVVVVVVLLEIIVLVLGGLAVVYSGVYNVAATDPHGHILAWLLDTGMTRSVVHHAAGIPVSPTYESPDLAVGYDHFSEMCITCHGAPGKERSEAGEGLYPNPPSLPEAAGDWTPPQLFWILKNGVKDTGMPAFGPTHSDEKLWDIAAFVKRLPDMTPEQFGAWSKAPHGENKGEAAGGASEGGEGRPSGG